MGEFHFVDDYEQLVEELIKRHPIDEAMSIAVGGGYDKVGVIEADVLRHAGLSRGMSLLDMGCGSGRLAHVLGKSDLALDYTGVDIIQSLLDYAATKCPSDYKFLKNRQLSWPMADGSVDMACGFSLFTHLLQHETFAYLRDLRRVLRSNGRVVFSFLEFAAPAHWSTFEHTIDNALAGTPSHLNMFMERSAIEVFGEHLGYQVVEYIEPDQSVSSEGHLGQSVVIMKSR